MAVLLGAEAVHRASSWGLLCSRGPGGAGRSSGARLTTVAQEIWKLVQTHSEPLRLFFKSPFTLKSDGVADESVKLKLILEIKLKTKKNNAKE